jgi:uncharacterized membrane protein
MKTTLWRNVRNNILIGLMLFLPVAVTVLIVNWLFATTTDVLVQWLPEAARKVPWELFLLRLASLAALGTVLFLAGLLARNVAGKRLYDLGDKLLARVPVFNKLYVSIRQISETLLNQSGGMFKDVVLLEYPRQGVFAVGFVTADVPAALALRLCGQETPEAWVGVFLPASPPTSGFFVLVRRTELRKLPISVADAMKLLISGGTVFPGTVGAEDGTSLLEKAEGWVERRS